MAADPDPILLNIKDLCGCELVPIREPDIVALDLFTDDQVILIVTNSKLMLGKILTKVFSGGGGLQIVAFYCNFTIGCGSALPEGSVVALIDTLTYTTSILFL